MAKKKSEQNEWSDWNAYISKQIEKNMAKKDKSKASKSKGTKK